MKSGFNRFAVRTLAAVVALSSSSFAANITKANNANALESGTSWTGGVAPGATGTAYFDANVVTTIANRTTSLGADVNWGTIRIDGGTGAFSITSAGGNTITLHGTTDASARLDSILLNSSAGPSMAIGANLAIGANNTYFTSSRTLTVSGNVNLGANTLKLFPAGSGSVIELGGVVSGTAGPGVNALLTDQNSGTGTIRLTNSSNSFTGNIELGSSASGMRLEFTSAGALGNTTQLRFRNTGGTAGSGSALVYVGTTDQTVSKAIQCDTSVGVRLESNSVGGKVVFDGSFSSVSGNRPIYLGGTGSGDNEIKSSIASNGSGSLTKRNGGKWILSGSNTFNGATTISGGTLQLGNGGTTGALSASSAITNNANLTINRSNAVVQGTDFSSAAITGTGSLTAAGTGTITLNASNSYSGGTTVNAGADLRINGAQTGAGTVDVAATGKLGGSGSVIGGINVSGVLAPGNSIESLGGGALSFTTGSTYAFELQTDLYGGTPAVAGDLVYSSGTLSIASGTILTLTDLAASTALGNGSKLTLISYNVGGTAGLGWNGGLFTYLGNPLTDGATFTLGANLWEFNYNDLTGGPNYSVDQSGATSFVTMTVVPEPGAALLGGIGMLILLRRRRIG